MLHREGVAYYPYVLLTEGDPVLGFDRRPLAQVEKEWLEKGRISAAREANQKRAEARAAIQNDVLVAAKAARAERDQDSDVPGEVPAASVTLDEVAAPPAEVLDADEVMRLAGLSDGYGAASIYAGHVVGVARAWGEAAEDFCAGAARVDREARRVKLREKKGRKS